MIDARLFKGRVPLKRVFQTFAVGLVLVFWAVYLWHNWQGLRSLPWQFRSGAAALAILSGIGYWLSLAFAWQRLHRAAGGGLTWQEGLRIWSVSSFARYIPGNVWHAVGRNYLCEHAGENRRTTLLSFTLEQVLTLLGALLAFLLSLPFWSGEKSAFLPLLFLLPLGLVGIHPAVFGRVLGRLLTAIKRPAFETRLTFGANLRLLLLYLTPNVFAGLSLGATLAMSTDLSWRFAPMLIGSFAIGWVAGYVSLLTPSGLGIREGALVILLAPQFGLAAATAASLISRIALTIAEALIVVYWQFGARR